MNNKSYSALILEVLNDAGHINYGFMDVLIERCRGRAEIMRCGMSRFSSKCTRKYRAGEPLSDIEAECIYESGLRRMRYTAFMYLKRKGTVINDQTNRTFVRK